jgi:hypothetical protein
MSKVVVDTLQSLDGLSTVTVAALAALNAGGSSVPTTSINPTAKFLRGDGTFTNQLTAMLESRVAGPAGFIATDTTQAPNAKSWFARSFSGTFTIDAATDDLATLTTALRIARNAGAPTVMSLMPGANTRTIVGNKADDGANGLQAISLGLTNALAIAYGGTGAATRQGAIDALTNVAGASSGYVLTKDSVSGSASFKALPARAIKYDVKADFGAVGDGVADDTTPVQNAINAAHAVANGSVFLPDGIYKVGPLTIPAFPVAGQPGFTMYGTGRRTSTLLLRDNNMALFTWDQNFGESPREFRDFGVDGSYVTYTSAVGFAVTRGRDVSLHSMYFKNVGYAGVFDRGFYFHIYDVMCWQRGAFRFISTTPTEYINGAEMNNVQYEQYNGAPAMVELYRCASSNFSNFTMGGDGTQMGLYIREDCQGNSFTNVVMSYVSIGVKLQKIGAGRPGWQSFTNLQIDQPTVSAIYTDGLHTFWNNVTLTFGTEHVNTGPAFEFGADAAGQHLSNVFIQDFEQDGIKIPGTAVQTFMSQVRVLNSNQAAGAYYGLNCTAASASDPLIRGCSFDSTSMTGQTLAGGESAFANDVIMAVAGKGLKVKEGSNARMGEATLVAGTVTVANTSVTASTRIIYARKTTGGTAGHLSTTRVNSTSFTINSSDAADTSVIDWLLVEPAA